MSQPLLRKVGDRVSLRIGGSMGMLNPLALEQDGYKGAPVEIIAVDPDGSYGTPTYTVKISDREHGTRQIKERDIK